MIHIQSAEEKDLGVIQLLAKKIWPLTYGAILSTAQLEYMLDRMYSIVSLTKQLNTYQHHFYLAFEEKLPVGFASVSADKTNSSVFTLQKIYVLPDYQGKHIGNSLLEKVKSHALENGGKSLRLNVNRFNASRHFYEKKGFIIIEEVDNDIGKGYFMNDYIMECSLSK
jgi:ribosomal protein S18 acetylase RimI-like enzyme